MEVLTEGSKIPRGSLGVWKLAWPSIITNLFYATSSIIAIKVVGLILVIALLTIPIYIAERLSNSLISMMIISSILSSIFTLSGLWLSYSYDLTSGASIIMISAVSLGIFLFISWLLRK